MRITSPTPWEFRPCADDREHLCSGEERVLVDEDGVPPQEVDANWDFVRAAVNSYGHFADPLQAAEDDLLGDLLFLVRQYADSDPNDCDCELCLEAKALLSKVNP